MENYKYSKFSTILIYKYTRRLLRNQNKFQLFTFNSENNEYLFITRLL